MAVIHLTTKLMNKLTPAQTERLVLMMEECSEVIQACSKIIRFGTDEQNIKSLETEIGDVSWIMEMMIQAGDIDEGSVIETYRGKAERMKDYIYYQ